LASDASLRRVPLSQLAEKPPREPHHPEDTPGVLQQLAQQLPEPASWRRARYLHASACRPFGNCTQGYRTDHLVAVLYGGVPAARGATLGRWRDPDSLRI